ncbi:MAG: LacI family DNA-binding transcriptional regulator [Janthinobacterium lividum]
MEDVAREARVSVATVDRAINRRPGVHSRTISRIEAAIAKLNYRPDPVATRLSRNQAFQFCFILPVSGTSFVALLSEQVRLTAEWLAPQRAYIETILVDVFDPEALASTLEGLGTRYQGVATVALDHPRVRDALDELARFGVAVVTLVSDAPTARRLRYIGIDNTAAGRTAGSLMGRFLGGRVGRVGLIAGSMVLRDHSERRFGFCQVIGTDHPALTLQPVSEGRDDERQNEAIVREMLQVPDIIGIYNIGAGNRGVAAALEAAGRAHDVVYIGHELTAHTRRFLVRGIMDACINQDAGHEIRSAARVLMAHCLNEPLVPDQERIRIDIFIRDNLP